MSSKTWTLTDASRQIWHKQFSAGPDDLPLPGGVPWSVQKYALRGGLSDGVDVVEVNNGRLSFSVLPTRGMGLWKGECDGLPVGWKSPIKLPVNPSYINLTERGGLGWLRGFNEWVCRCGLNSNGPPGNDVIIDNQGNKATTQLTLHGLTANLPAYLVEVTVDDAAPGTISVMGVVDEAMLFGPCLRLKSTVSTTAGSNRLTIVDEVSNLGSAPSELQLLYHVNVGGPFLDADARFVAPIREAAPRDARAQEDIDALPNYRGPTPGFVEQVYWFDLHSDRHGRSQVLLRNAHGDKGFGLQFNTRQLPCFTLWKNTQAEADGYVTGLEPGTNFPNPKTVERQHGRVILLEPGGRYETRLEMVIHGTADGVHQAEQEIAALQRIGEATIHRTPQAKYLSKE